MATTEGKILVYGFDKSQNFMIYDVVNAFVKGYKGTITVTLKDQILTFDNTNKTGFVHGSSTIAALVANGEDLLRVWCKKTLEGSLHYDWENTTDHFTGPIC